MLADESRIRILALLAARESSVEELADRLGLRSPTVSHHLARLKGLGPLSMRREGTTHVYRFEPDRLSDVNRSLDPERWAGLAGSPDAEDDPFAAKVLRDVFVGKTLKDIPASRAKRRVVLEWLAGRLEPGVRYPERAVNEVLRQHHPDFATLRRELIVSGLMDRAGGTYWRTASQTDSGRTEREVTGEPP